MFHNESLPSFVILELNGLNTGKTFEDLNLPYKTGVGSYKGACNICYLVLFRSLNDLRSILRVASENAQESILVVDTQREAQLWYLEPDLSYKVKKVGKWSEIPLHKITINTENWSSFDNRFFICE